MDDAPDSPDCDEDTQEQHRGSGPAPWNAIGMYLRNASGAKPLSRDDEKAWFQVIEASSERLFNLFSRYPFAAEMYIRELEHLASGSQHFDSVVSEGSGMGCAAYKKSIPEMRRSVCEAMDMLAGASTLRQAISSKESEDILDTARKGMGRALRALSFRQSVVEDLCDIAYEDVYLPCLRRRSSGDCGADGEDRSSVMFGMSVEEFLDSFAEVRSMLDIIHMARSRIAEANLRLVVHVAKKYVNRGIELSDLLQDGSMGLMNAIRKFDLSRGHRFSTFATWWIRQAISRALTNNSRTIRIPSHKIDQLNRMYKAERELSQSLNRSPTASETARKMGVSAEEVCRLRDMRQQTVSLDGSVGDEGDASLVDMMGDDCAPDPAEGTERSLVRDKVREALSMLSDRERSVVDLRFGLSDGVARTLEEIGRLFNVTREHIRQIELDALAKLRESNALGALAGLA